MVISLTYSKENVEESIPIKDRIRQFQSQNQTEDATMSKPAKQRPSSAAFDLFESQGLIISQVGGDQIKNTVKYFLIVGIQFSLFSWLALPTNLQSNE